MSRDGVMQASRPLKILATETSGKSFSCHRFCFEHYASPDQERPSAAPVDFEVLDSGESHPVKVSMDLSSLVNRLRAMHAPPLFRFFLDGSRRTYKVDDVEYGRRIFPVLAGQLGVACCERVDRDTFRPVGSASEVRLVLAVPAYADANGESGLLRGYQFWPFRRPPGPLSVAGVGPASWRVPF
jgi:hypothetical protein